MKTKKAESSFAPLAKWKYDAVLFDFDGTLADTREDVWDALAHAAGALGSSLPVKVRQNAVNLGLPMHTLLQMLQPAPNVERLQDFEAETARYYRRTSRLPHTRLYPGIKQLLEVLRRDGIPCYIVSLKEHKALQRVLELKGWGMYFAGHYSPDSLQGQRRSKSQVLAGLLPTLGAQRPVYIGDSYSDVIAARENNVPCIGVTYGDGDTRELLAAQPYAVVESALQLEDVLQCAPTDALDGRET